MSVPMIRLEKRCIYHHPHRDLAVGDRMTDSRQPTVNVPQVRSNALSTEDDTISMTPHQQFFIDRIGVNQGKSLEKYIKDISEMYPETNVARFGEIMKLPDGTVDNGQGLLLQRAHMPK